MSVQKLSYVKLLIWVVNEIQTTYNCYGSRHLLLLMLYTLLSLKYVTVYNKTMDCRESFIDYEFLNHAIRGNINACRFFGNWEITMQQPIVKTNRNSFSSVIFIFSVLTYHKKYHPYPFIEFISVAK